MFPPVVADLRGRTSVVTGATSGIGKEAARGLARLGARVVLACRSPERGEAVRREIAADSGNPEVELAVVDVSSQASVREFAARLSARHPSLHVLVNNAGIWSRQRRDSADGIERTWATNVLGYFLVTRLLHDALAAGRARIVNVASMLARDLDLTDVEFGRRRYQGVVAYAQSKQANRLFTWALDRRLAGTGITANAMHPGGVNTPLFAKAGGMLGRVGAAYAKLFGRSAAEGADTVVWLAASPELEGVSGKLWIDRREVRCRLRDPQAEERLWQLCESMTANVAA